MPEPTKFQKTFSAGIRERRLSAGMSVRQAVEIFNQVTPGKRIGDQTWWQWESETEVRHRDPSLAHLPTIARVLGVESVKDLLPQIKIKPVPKQILTRILKPIA